VVVIVSNGRTGTTALARHLDRCYSNVRALHEPGESGWKLRRASIRGLSKNISERELAALLEEHWRGLASLIDRPVYVESNPMLQGFIDVFGQIWPAVKVVHVVRDPRTFVRSSINFGAMRGVKGMMARWCPWWLPKPEHFDRNVTIKWKDMHPVERMAWFWRIVNSDLNRGEMIYGENYLRVKFEDLFAEDGSGLQQLTEWMGLPKSSSLNEEARKEKVNASQRDVLPKWEDWQREIKEMVLRQCS